MDGDRSRPRLEAQRTHERPHVLVVTDDQSLTEFLNEGLPLGGFWVSPIASGLQALEVFRLRGFDIVVVDAGLRSFNALEFLKRLRGRSDRDRNREPRTNAPVVIIQAGPEPIDVDPSLAVAAEITPPIELEDVVRLLHDVFEEWRARHPGVPLADSANFRAF